MLRPSLFMDASRSSNHTALKEKGVAFSRILLIAFMAGQLHPRVIFEI
jgi:hypothetical protein